MESKEFSTFQSPDEFIAVKKKCKDPGRWRDLVAFWILGVCNNFGYVVMLSAAHDIIKSLDLNHSAPTKSPHDGSENKRICQVMSVGAVLLADTVPSLLAKLIGPFLPFFIDIRVLLICILQCAGFVLVALANKDWVVFIGIICTSIGGGLGESSFLGYSSRFNRKVILTYASGGGGAGILGSFSYAGLIALGFSPTHTMLTMLIVPVIVATTFWILLRSPHKIPKHDLDCECNRTTSDQTNDTQKELSTTDKIHYIPSLLKYMIPLFSIFLLEYFINQGLLELVYFENIWIDHDAQYRWLQVDYQIGAFISRSSVSLFTIHKIWLLAVLQLINVVLVLTEVLTFFSPTIWVVFAIVLWEGLLGGSAFVNAFYRMSKEVPKNRQMFAMGITCVADTIGVSLAGLIAIPVHNALCKMPMPLRN